MEIDTAEHIKPFITEEVAKNIIDKKLTLAGCFKYCHDKGKAFEIKTDKGGFAPVTQEQHFTWCREYFGITSTIPAAAPGSLGLDIDNLFD